MLTYAVNSDQVPIPFELLTLLSMRAFVGAFFFDRNPAQAAAAIYKPNRVGNSVSSGTSMSSCTIYYFYVNNIKWVLLVVIIQYILLIK